MDLLVASKTEIENFDILNRNVRSVIVKAKFRTKLHINLCRTYDRKVDKHRG